MDAIPIFSQAKSFIQWICRDAEGARQTQINFSRQCPVISQARSAVEAAMGNQKAARETQIEFGHFVGSFVNGIPVLGHIKGTVHYALKDKNEGDAAMKAASHTTAVIGGGVGGFFIGGPVGAVAGGVGAGVAIDATITGADSAINKEFKPYGALQPIGDPTNPGKWVDAVGGMALDGLTGRGAGSIAQVIKSKAAPKPSGIAETVVKKGILPTTFKGIIDKILIMVRKKGPELVLRVLKNVLGSGKDCVELDLCNPNENKNPSSLGGDDLQKIGICSEKNGRVVKFYSMGKLILVNEGGLVCMVNDKGRMEKIMDGPEYYLCSDGTFITEPERGVESRNPENWVLARSELASRKSVSLTYDSEERTIAYRHEELEIKHSVQQRVSRVISLT